MPFVRLSGFNWRSIFRSPTMVQDLDREVSRIMERFVPMVTVRGGWDAAWFNGDCKRAFELKQSVYHRWCRNRSAVNWDYSAEHEELLIDSMRLWRLVTLLIAVRTLMPPDIPPLCSPGGALASDLAGKAELLSAWFDSKQSRYIVEWPHTQ